MLRQNNANPGRNNGEPARTNTPENQREAGNARARISGMKSIVDGIRACDAASIAITIHYSASLPSQPFS